MPQHLVHQWCSKPACCPCNAECNTRHLASLVDNGVGIRICIGPIRHVAKLTTSRAEAASLAQLTRPSIHARQGSGTLRHTATATAPPPWWRLTCVSQRFIRNIHAFLFACVMCGWMSGREVLEGRREKERSLRATACNHGVDHQRSREAPRGRYCGTHELHDVYYLLLLRPRWQLPGAPEASNDLKHCTLR
jgi:hypothetical protein